MRPRKDYTITSASGEVVRVEEYREAPWVQKWSRVTFDFRRWLYVCRPRLDGHGHGTGLIHAGRDEMVEIFRDAIKNIIGVTEKTKQTYCYAGLATFFQYLDSRQENDKVTELSQINKELLEDYILWLRNRPSRTKSGRLGYSYAKNCYAHLKSVLQHLVQQELLSHDIFPVNPFPHSNRALESIKPYPKPVMKALMAALQQDLDAIQDGRLTLTPKETLVVYLLMIAARSGRNPDPLMQATRDALKPHPIKPKKYMVLQLYKNRGNATSIQGFRFQKEVEETINISMGVVELFYAVDRLTAPLAAEAFLEIRDKVWLYRVKSGASRGKIKVLDNYQESAQSIVKRHNLEDIDGKRLRLNISRLRATFVQRMWYLTGGDLVKTAKLAGNTVAVADHHYLSPGPESEANHRLFGISLYAQLSGKIDDPAAMEDLSQELGMPKEQLIKIADGTNTTGVGRCRDPLHGHGKKSKGDGDECTAWLACFRCPDQIVMESDLYRLYSFYYLLIKEKNYLRHERWENVYGSVVRIIDDEIIAPNLCTPQNPKGCFNPLRVKEAKERGDRDPHPMWRNREMLFATGFTQEFHNE